MQAARVIVSNESKGITRNLTSNDAGLFSAPGLVPATGYSVIISREGFQNFEAKEIQIEVGQNINVSATLGVASAAAQVDVTSELPIVDTNKHRVFPRSSIRSRSMSCQLMAAASIALFY